MSRSLDIERTPDGIRLAVSRTIDAPRERVWNAFVDTRRWPDWGPSVTAVECEDRRISAGSTGRIRTVGGCRLRFAITTCSDYRWTWRVGPVRGTGHRVDPSSPGHRGCRAVIELPLLAAPYAVVCWLALVRLDRLVTGS